MVVPSLKLRSLLLSILFFGTCLFGLMLLSGCSSTSPQNEEDALLIGRPPPPEEDDPFFAQALPAEAVPAEPSGQIGTPRREEVVEEPTPEAAEDVVEESTPEVVEEEVQESIIPPEHQEARTACFSCVRICTTDASGRADCGEDNDDLICGWGSHQNADEARRSASAHCDATLDMARQMPTYSEISGSCPRATCQ